MIESFSKIGILRPKLALSLVALLGISKTSGYVMWLFSFLLMFLIKYYYSNGLFLNILIFKVDCLLVLADL